MNYVFFGTPDRAVFVLEELKSKNLLPSLIITATSKPVGRKQVITPSPVNLWAQQNNIPVETPINKQELSNLETLIKEHQPDFLITVAYGYLIPDNILELAKYYSLNIHYSLLPKWRGASPVVQQILNRDSQVGYSVMEMVTELDAGAIFYQKSFPIPVPLPTTDELARTLSIIAGKELPEILDLITNEALQPVPQDLLQVTHCTKLTKADGEIDLSEDPEVLHAKIKAYQPWPKTFFFCNKLSTLANQPHQRIRVVINDAEILDGKINIISVTPEGKSAITWEQFVNWLGYDPLLDRS